jgi:cellulose synthase/poly-beta-1,6-N-acetylglucosamine synthase-like glycosyltransferase
MEMNLLDFFLSSFTALYALTLVILSAGLLFYNSPRSKEKKPFVSVIIAARNEEKRISACLQLLLSQTYPREFFEVIVINDRSSDRTGVLVESFQKEFAELRLVTLTETPPVMAPKKHALNEGIKSAKGEIIVCTDADCRPEENWLSSMVSCFTEKVGMVVGFSPIDPKRSSLLDNFVALDSLALASLSAAGTAYGMTLTATGRSLAYRKKVFEEVGGFSKIAHFVSGDDDLLLGLVKKTHWKTAYCIGDKTLVPTDPPGSFISFVHQKIRQASKGRHYGFKMTAGLTLFYIYNVLMISYVPANILLSNAMSQKLFYMSFWIIKLISDLLILTIGAWRFGRFRFLSLYPLIAMVHPFYITVFGAWGLFGKFEWKND